MDTGQPVCHPVNEQGWVNCKARAQMWGYSDILPSCETAPHQSTGGRAVGCCGWGKARGVLDGKRGEKKHRAAIAFPTTAHRRAEFTAPSCGLGVPECLLPQEFPLRLSWCFSPSRFKFFWGEDDGFYYTSGKFLTADCLSWNTFKITFFRAPLCPDLSISVCYLLNSWD